MTEASKVTKLLDKVMAELLLTKSCTAGSMHSVKRQECVF